MTRSQVSSITPLRDPTDRNNFSFPVWEWVFFDLNGYRWVRRVEDLPDVSAQSLRRGLG